jgi:hypothetical protein
MHITRAMLREFRQRTSIPPVTRYAPGECSAAREILDTIDGLLNDGLTPEQIYLAYLGCLREHTGGCQCPGCETHTARVQRHVLVALDLLTRPELEP